MRIINRSKIYNKYLNYYLAHLKIVKKGIINFYNGSLDFSKIKPTETKEDVIFECIKCGKEFEIYLPKGFFDLMPKISEDMHQIQPLMDHIKKDHKSVKIVRKCLRDIVSKKWNLNFSNWFWCDINDLVSLIPGDEYENCTLCSAFSKDFSFCFSNHLEFIKYPKKSKCIDFR